MLIFILFISALTQESHRIRKALYDTYQEVIQTTDYNIGQGQSIILQYNKQQFLLISYDGVYGMLLNKTVYGQQIQQVNNVSYDPLTKPGCWTYERRLSYHHLFEVTPQYIGDAIFTSMFVFGQSIYAVRNDYSFVSLYVNLNDSKTAEPEIISGNATHDLKKYLNDNGTSIADDLQIICSIKVGYCYIFTPSGLVSFQGGQNGAVIGLKKLQLRSDIYPQNIFIDEQSQILFISLGVGGIDYYIISTDGSLTFQRNIEGNFVQVYSNDEGSRLYALDQKRGLIIFNINSVNEIQQSSFYIQLMNAKSFDFFKNTFFILAETFDSLPYVLEVFLTEDQYYFNKIYSQDVEIYDVYVNEQFAVLIGSQAHRVIYHSIFNRFEPSTQIDLYFEDVDLVHIEALLENPTTFWKNAIETEPFHKLNMSYKQSYLVGMSDNEINLFAIKNLPPWIQCKASTIQKEYYSLEMNSTTCNAKTEKNDYSPMTLCKVTHEFTLEGNKLIFKESDYLKIAIVMGICTFLLLTLTLLIVFCYRRWKRIIEQKQKELPMFELVDEKHDKIFTSPHSINNLV